MRKNGLISGTFSHQGLLEAQIIRFSSGLPGNNGRNAVVEELKSGLPGNNGRNAVVQASEVALVLKAAVSKLCRLSNFYYRWPYLASAVLRLHLKHGRERLLKKSGGVGDDHS
ncbi:hypothetical protein [Paenibacillus sonchi]|uniref:hypothetical protein n=1 Tax=Paenibacillus sonchi TaxID=373687 RepID=UPI001E60E5F4|nr:hypothetical protein [Paenibacillus sonchi]MCE3198284.1 hypothetical protein [Paenibacillus sonchi]